MLDVLYYLLCPVLSFSGEAEGVLKAEEKEAIVKALRYLGQDLAAFLKYKLCQRNVSLQPFLNTSLAYKQHKWNPLFLIVFLSS